MSELQSLPLTQSWSEEYRILGDHMRQKAIQGQRLNILEAGCGQKWDIDLTGIDYLITGLDTDAAALDIRKNIVKDLDQTIVGDLRDVQLAENVYDVIFCSYVLEHIENAESVLNNFVRWLKPEGIMIIQIPDPESVKGFITRVTPHWFHVFYYRYIRGMKNAGKPGYGPYRTCYDPVVSRNGMREFCNKHNLSIKAEYGTAWRRHGSGIIADSIQLFQRCFSIASRGRLSWQHEDLTFVLEKQPAA